MGFYGEVGPQLGILMSSETSGGGVSLDTKDSFTSTDIGLCIGAGFKFENGIGIGARYGMGLTSLDNVDDGIDDDVKNSVISLGLLYTFGSK
jgi:opacity protein-like surface antigen